MTRRYLLFPALAALLLSPLSAAAPPRVDVLVQGAVDSELEPLIAALSNPRTETIAAWTFWVGKIGSKRVVVSRTDVGPINAAACTTVGILRYQPQAIINQGTAGGHNRKLKLWDIVVGERHVDYSAFRSVHADQGAGQDTKRWAPMYHKLRVGGPEPVVFEGFPGHAPLIAAALSTPYSRGKVYKGVIGTAFQYNREIDHIDWIHKIYGTDSEDMESAASAGAAAGFKVPFVAVRIISDTEWEHPTFERVAGVYCAQFVLDMVRRMRP